MTGLFDPLFLRLQISIAVGIILSSPIWLYQLWAFIAPGLYQRERRWAYYFVGAALPLFAHRRDDRLLRDDQGPAVPAGAGAARRDAR